MKKINFIFGILSVFISLSCHRKPVQYEPDWAAKLDSLYVWDIKPEIDGALMFLDVAYQTCDSCVTDFLTMSVAKHKLRKHPDWIAVILPDNLLQKEGVFLFFDEKKDAKSKSEKSIWSIHLDLEKQSNNTFVVRLKDGFAVNENNQKADILQKFLESETLYCMIFYANGQHKTIAVPLKFFKKQYQKLE